MRAPGGYASRADWIQIALLFFIALAPVRFSSAAQPPRMQPFEREIQAFEASDRTNPPPKGAVLFVGSSSIRLWSNLATNFPELTVIQRGFGGSHLPDCTRYAGQIIIPYQPSKILIYAGDNDIARGDSPRLVFEHFKQFATKVHTALPNTDIYFLSIKPSPSRWHLSPQAIEANDLIRKYCARHRKLKFVDCWTPLLDASARPDPALFRPDQLHLNEQGYARWVPAIRHALGLK
jgi:lysophospholipase L1-like esterase